MNLQSVLIISFCILSLLGTLLHFTHNWFKNGVLLHIFSAVNESTWEHMKLLVLPTILVMMFQYIFLTDTYSNLLASFLVLYLAEILVIPLLYEILNLILREVHFLITISIFYIAIFIGIFSQHLMLMSNVTFLSERISFVLIILITILFAIYTYYPPKVFLFRDPLTGKYGDTGKHT